MYNVIYVIYVGFDLFNEIPNDVFSEVPTNNNKDNVGKNNNFLLHYVVAEMDLTPIIVHFHFLVHHLFHQFVTWTCRKFWWFLKYLEFRDGRFKSPISNSIIFLQIGSGNLFKLNIEVKFASK